MDLNVTTTCEDIVFEQHGINYYLDKLFYNEHLVWSRPNASHDYSQDYFTMEAQGNGSFLIRNRIGFSSTTIQYSKNGGAWTTVTSTAISNTSTTVPNPAEIPVDNGDVVRIKASLNAFGATASSHDNNAKNYPHVGATCEYKVYGNIESLFSGDNFIANSNNYRALAHMFDESSTIWIYAGYPQKGAKPEQWTDGQQHYLTDAENLVMRISKSYYVWYSDNSSSGSSQLDCTPGAAMFAGCEKLVLPPKKTNVSIEPNYTSGTNISFGQCGSMFSHCIRMKKCDWVIDIVNGGFSNMFDMCISMEKGPDMIRRWGQVGNLGLAVLKETSSKIQAGSFNRGITNMFSNCVSMKRAPVIIGEHIGNWTNNTDGKDGSNMFFNCQSLEEIRIYECDWKKSDMSSPVMDYAYNNDPFDLGSITGRTSVVTSGTWSSTSSSLGPLTIYSNFTRTGWDSNPYITTILEPPTADIISWYCQ